MDVMRICGCDELIDSDSTKFDSNRHYHTCYLQVVDNSYTLQDTFDNWMKKVLNDVNLHNNELNKTINESLSRQLQEGVLNQYEYAELEYITRLWIKYKNSFNLYKLGCNGSKKEILMVLLELFELKQISKDILINTLMELC